MDVNIEEHNTDGTDEERTVPTVGIKSPVEFPSVDSQTSEGTNDNRHESDSTLPRFAAIPILRRSARLSRAPKGA